jgi:hypothetical protein
MVDQDSVHVRSQASRDYSRARMLAFWDSLLGVVTKRETELLNFEEVKAKLRLHNQRSLGLRNVPLDKIVGSVGRYQDFTRKFLPKSSVNKERWENIDALARGMRGFPPVELYKVGDAYFVSDGNHRVSVARQIGMPTIEAYVNELILPADVDIDENLTQEQLIIKAGYLEFLRQTRLDKLRPDSDVELTEPGMYGAILEHIDVHKYFMDLEARTEHTYEEAVASWYDNVYMPMVKVIREYDLLKDFDDRTEADLYVWLIRHQGALTKEYGDQVIVPSPRDTAEDFREKLA